MIRPSSSRLDMDDNMPLHQRVVPDEQDISPIDGNAMKENLMTTVKKKQVNYVVAHNHKNPLTMQRDRSYTHQVITTAFKFPLRTPVQPSNDEDTPANPLTERFKQSKLSQSPQHHNLPMKAVSTKLVQKEHH